MDAAELDVSHDAEYLDPEDEADVDREAADEDEVQQLEAELPALVAITLAQDREARAAFEKVSSSIMRASESLRHTSLLV